MPINVTEEINNAFKAAGKKFTELKVSTGELQSTITSAAADAQSKLTTAINSGDLQSKLNSALDSGKLNSLLDSATKLPVPKIPENIGITKAQTETFTAGASRDILSSADAPVGAPVTKVKASIPVLLQSDVKVIMLQIAQMETGNDYTYDGGSYLGKYAVHTKTLANYGYTDSTGAFTGKDGVKSKEEFLYDSVVQDRIMERYLQDQYKALIKNKGIKDNDTKDVVAGMVAVAYQFQDASPGASSLTNIDTSSLVSSASSLADGLKTASLPGSGATIPQIDSLVNSSGVFSKAESLLATNPTDALSALKSGDSLSKSAISTVQSIKDSATKAVTAAKEALTPAATAMADTLKKQAAKIDINKLKSSASDLATAIPASKAKDWRNAGTAKDSKGRPGSLFFNAGRYAIKTLGADIPVSA